MQLSFTKNRVNSYQQSFNPVRGLTRFDIFSPWQDTRRSPALPLLLAVTNLSPWFILLLFSFGPPAAGIRATRLLRQRMATAIEAWWSWSKLQEISKRQNSMEKNPWKYRRHLCDLLKMGRSLYMHDITKAMAQQRNLCCWTSHCGQENPWKGHLRLEASDAQGFVQLCLCDLSAFNAVLRKHFLRFILLRLDRVVNYWYQLVIRLLRFLASKLFEAFCLQWMQAWRLQNWCLLDTLRLFTSWAKCWNLRSRKKNDWSNRSRKMS